MVFLYPLKYRKLIEYRRGALSGYAPDLPGKLEGVGDNLSPRPRDLGKKTSIFMYDERGILDVIRWSTTEVADQYFDWVYDIIQSIKKNGYYIASEKDNKWLEVRNESKQARRYETDQIKLFVEYAKEQGSKNTDRYYMIFTKRNNWSIL